MVLDQLGPEGRPICSLRQWVKSQVIKVRRILERRGVDHSSYSSSLHIGHYGRPLLLLNKWGGGCLGRFSSKEKCSSAQN